MKKCIFLAGMALTALLASCSDDDLSNEGGIKNPVQTGDEILFGSTLSGDADDIDVNGSTRTIYGNRTNTGIPVYWKEEGDSIAVFCLQASQPADHLVNYTVKPIMEEDADGNKFPSEKAASVVKFDSELAGLQWGDTDTEHKFYAFYPASAVKGSDEENETGMITANIPVTQQVQEWREGVYMGTDPNLTRKKIYYGLPNMNYAYMYAYNAVTPSKVDKDNVINLQFHNLVTVLDITVQGPSSGTATITNINVDALTEEGAQPILTGDFTCNIRNASTGEGAIATCTPVGSFSEERGRISIPCYDKKTGSFIQLGPDDLLNVKAYIIPQDENTVTRRTLRITVATLNGAPCRKTLNTADITPHKINRVLLPPLQIGGTNYWMSSLDRNIYASELSIPGSKFSFLTPANGVSVRNFQNHTIKEQFEDGVRAFIVQTAGYAEYTKQDDTYTHSGKDQLYVTVNGSILNKDGKNVTLEDVLSDLKQCIDDAKGAKGEDNNEYVIVQLTYEGAPCNSNYGNFDSERIWIEALQGKINSLKNNANDYYLFIDEITPNTRIADLREHIVLKVNYNTTKMGSYISENAEIPALFSKWDGKYGDVPLRWGTPNESSLRSTMHWLYQEATHVGENTEITYSEKEYYIKRVFDESYTKYLANDAHDTWFMNDIGGRYKEDTDDAVTSLTTRLNKYSVDLLQDRSANASLGLVFLNFADKRNDSGVLYQSDWLIQTIIDNNFKFALRKASDTTNNTTNSDASYISGGSVIK